MIYEYDKYNNAPRTIQFLSTEKWIKRGYYENGNLGWEIPYKNGKKHGLDKDYYVNGNLKWEILYKNGMPQ